MMCVDVRVFMYIVYVYVIEEKRRPWVLVGCGNRVGNNTEKGRELVLSGQLFFILQLDLYTLL